MDIILALAHFCEIHGPTIIATTQLSQDPCAVCHPYPGTPSSEIYPKRSTPVTQHWDPQLNLSSPFQSPPTSPQTAEHNPYFPNVPGEREITGRFGPNAEPERESDVCDSCTIVIPKELSDKLPEGAPGSPRKEGKGRNGSPVMRSTQTVLVLGSATDTDDEDEPLPAQEPASVQKQSSLPTSNCSTSPSVVDSATSSPPWIPRNRHLHTLRYVTTRQPASPSTYSLLRRSCLRTLSGEKLPKNGSSGPISFGDPIAGYTTTYVFRIADPRAARGRWRKYALIALSGRSGLRAARTLVKITESFEAMSQQIIAMAQEELERESSVSSASSRPSTGQLSTPPFGSMAPPPVPTTPGSPRKASPGMGSPIAKNITPVSSFLTAKRVDPDGNPRSARDLIRAKGLSEIVGKDTFFVELHVKFTTLLAALVNELEKS
ncbi:hypothetical protein K402DRAFT_31669 [Aulographum hederae CBS 113979]|uniref:Folliculin/SMCR8 longin domain-containing protein n=1 Tax=Aulographum hederae CBS 113979 TaxID=1176131 RepID=A0A6G1H5A5_9PEZI|nr:hypothetical protein K402DRAFT_31669 [Aulographum hederae CBS 113979]